MMDNTPPQQSGNIDLIYQSPLLTNHQVIVADVLFGSPRSNCSGQGICKVIAPVSGQLLNSNQWTCKRSVALIRMISEQLVAFHFVKASMCHQVLESYFKELVFVIEEPVTMQLSTWQQKTWEIKPGYYPITTQKNYFTTILKTTSQLNRAEKIGLYTPLENKQMNTGGG
jgi:hypothetical protein